MPSQVRFVSAGSAAMYNRRNVYRAQEEGSVQQTTGSRLGPARDTPVERSGCAGLCGVILELPFAPHCH